MNQAVTPCTFAEFKALVAQGQVRLSPKAHEWFERRFLQRTTGPAGPGGAP